MIARRATAALGILAFTGMLGLNIVMASFIGDSYVIGDCFDRCPRSESDLVRLADQVFVGTIVSDGTFVRRWDSISVTVFEVQVVEVLKGDVGSTARIGQLGGVDGWGIRHVVQGERPLTIGSTYVFATRTSDARVGLLVIPRAGAVDLSPGDRDARIARFRDAVGG